MAAREVESRLGDRDLVDARDARGAIFVVRDIGVERLLRIRTLEIPLQLRPAREPMLPRELPLRGGEDDLLPCRAGRAHSLLRLLAQLLEIELLGHARLLSVLPVVRRSGGKKLVVDLFA